MRYAAANVRRLLREMGLFPGYGWTREMMRRASHKWRKDGKPVLW
ncbi:hypothetical protein [Paraburkholderia kururiensis]